MLPKNTTRSEISTSTIAALISEKDRTGLGPSAIFQYAKSLDLVETTQTLKAGMIKAWLEGESRSAYAEDITVVLRAYHSIVFESEMPDDADERRLVLLSDGLGAELQAFLSARTASVRKLMLNDLTSPKGLTESKLRRLAEGRERIILFSHLKFIRRAMNKWLSYL